MIEMTESVLDEVVGGHCSNRPVRVSVPTVNLPNFQQNIGTITVKNFSVAANTSGGSLGGLSGGITLANSQSNSYVYAPYAGNAFNTWTA
jgi:hypothetical protein